MKKTVIFLPLILLFMSAATVENSTEATLEWTLLSAFPGRPAYDSFFSPNNTELLVLDLDGDDVLDFSFFTGGDNGVGELRIVSGANPGLSTTISYSLQQSGKIEITIFDLLGRAVRSLVQGHKLTGRYSVLWDGRNDAGSLVSSGTYFYRLKAGEAVETQQMLFLK